MNKAQELLSVVKSITEEGEMGPLNLAVGSKVVCMKDGVEMLGVVKADDSGKFYDAEKDMYFVFCDGTDAGVWVPAVDLKMAESKKKVLSKGMKTFEERLALLRKKNEEGAEAPAPDAEVSKDDLKKIMTECYCAAMDNINMMKECMGMTEDASDYGQTIVALGSMYDAGKALGDAMDSEGLSIPGYCGGVGIGGTEIPTPAGGSDQPAPTV